MALQLDDEELIRSFQAGDERVFDMVVAENRDALRRHAVRRLGDAAAADDAVQEVFLRAYRSFGRLRPDSRITSWLHHIMVNVCIDEINRRRRHDDKAMRIVGQPVSYLVEPSIEQRLGLDRADTSPMRSAMESLPSTYQEALTMRFVDELSYEEMAAATGVSEENARARVSRARSAIRNLLRGVALTPVIGLVALVRRGPRAAATGIDQAQRWSETGSMATKMATSMAPAADTITAVATTAHTTVPLITKAAVGIGAVSMLAMTATPENVFQPARANDRPAVVAASTADASSNGSTADANASAPASAATGSSTGGNTATAASPASDPAAGDATNASPDAGSTGDAPASSGNPATATPAPVAEVPVVLSTGALSASGITVTQSGPRVDLSGPVTLTVGGTSYSGTLTGRLGLAPAADPAAERRFDGTLTIDVDGSRLEIRLQGFALPLDPPAPVAETPVETPVAETPVETPVTETPAETPAEGTPAEGTPAAGTPTDTNASTGTASDAVTTGSVDSASVPATVDSAGATRYSISGKFRVSNGDRIGLVAEGSFTGTFGPGSLTLTLG